LAVTVSGVFVVVAVPLVGETESQFPVEVALALNGVEDNAVTSIVWVCGAPPAAALKLREGGVEITGAAPSTDNKTGTTTETPPAAVGVRMMLAR
jgi:hypothetical protein